MKILSGLFLLFVTGILACNSPRPTSQTKAGDRDALYGVYTAVLPCADCEGIQTMIKLNADGSYEREMDYLGKPARPFRDSGRLKYDPSKSSVVLQENEPAAAHDFFLFTRGTLRQTDGEGKPVTGPLADRFLFHKQSFPILEQYWKLSAIDGKPIPSSENGRIPYIVFKAFGNRVQGNAGCNSFFGSFGTGAGNSLSFSGMGATKMACPDLEVEDAFFKALNSVNRFRQEGDTLTLENNNSGSRLQFIAPARH